MPRQRRQGCPRDEPRLGIGCKIIQNAPRAGAKVIDYDRLNTGCKGANYYISFDNPAVGKFMGAGVLAAMKKKSLLGAGKKPVIAYLNGGPTDNNSKLFKQGYAGVLDPLIKSGQAAKRPIRACRLGQPEGPDDLRADARQDRQQDRRGRRGERRPRERGRDGAQGEEAVADPGVRSGRYRPGRSEHHLRVAVRNGVQAGQGRGQRCGCPRGRTAQGKQAEDERHDEQRCPQRAVVPRDADWITKGNINLLYRDGQLKRSRCASARTSSTARANEPGWGSRASGFPTCRPGRRS